MCLLIDDDSVEQTAKSDLVCYKVLVKPKSCRLYQTFYKTARVKLGETYTSEIEKKQDWWNRHTIEKGLHSYKKLSDVFEEFPKGDYTSYPMFVVKCVIPRGSTYYVGHFGKYVSYASNRLRYKEIIYTY